MASAPVITAYKGFDRDLKCRGFQYEIGKTYTYGGAVEVCASGFHSCEIPMNVWSYYPPGSCRFAEVAASDRIDRQAHSSKLASSKITVTAELTLSEFVARSVNGFIAYAHAATTGYDAHAVTTGNDAHAATTGYDAHAVTTGNDAHAATTGNDAHAATTGNDAHAATTGYGAHAATTGNGAHAATTGDDAIASSLGVNATARAGDGGWIVLAAWKWAGDHHELLTIRTAKVGGPEGIEAHVSYRLNAHGEFERVGDRT